MLYVPPARDVFALPPSGSYSPSGQTWEAVACYRPFDLLPVGLSPTRQAFEVAGGTAGLVSAGGGSATVAGGAWSATTTTVVRARGQVRHPYQFAAIRIAGLPTNGAFVVGLIGASYTTRSLWAVYDHNNTRIQLESGPGSGPSVLGSAVTVTLAVGTWVGFSCNGPFVSLWTTTDPAGRAGWQRQITRQYSAGQDLRDAATLALYAPGFGVNVVSGTASVDRFIYGTFGATGIQNPKAVTYEDGTPYIRNGKLLMLATAGGPGATSTGASTGINPGNWGGIPGVHDAVWELDPTTGTLEMTAALFVSRGGRVLGDCGGSLMYHRGRRRWVYITDTWGDVTSIGTDGGSIRVQYGLYPHDLSRGVHVLSGQSNLGLPVGTGTWSQWEGQILEYGGYAYCAYAHWNNTDFRTTVARAAALDGTYTQVWQGSTANQEGQTIAEFGDVPYVIGSTTTGPAALALVDGSSPGSLPTFSSLGYDSSAIPPHLMPFAWPEGGNTRYYAGGFDSQSAVATGWDHGKFYLHRLAATRAGYEHGRVIRPPY